MSYDNNQDNNEEESSPPRGLTPEKTNNESPLKIQSWMMPKNLSCI